MLQLAKASGSGVITTDGTPQPANECSVWPWQMTAATPVGATTATLLSPRLARIPSAICCSRNVLPVPAAGRQPRMSATKLDGGLPPMPEKKTFWPVRQSSSIRCCFGSSFGSSWFDSVLVRLHGGADMYDSLVV